MNSSVSAQNLRSDNDACSLVKCFGSFDDDLRDIPWNSPVFYQNQRKKYKIYQQIYTISTCLNC